MRRIPYGDRLTAERGATLVEVMIALIVLSLGILALAQVFPAGTRAQQQDRMLSTATYYSQQKLEELSARDWYDTALDLGRHPATGFDSLGTSKAWLRFYQVDQLPAPLDNLKRVAVNVSWNFQGSRSVRDTLYLRK